MDIVQGGVDRTCDYERTAAVDVGVRVVDRTVVDERTVAVGVLDIDELDCN